MTGEYEQSQPERLQPHAHLRDRQEAAPVVAVGQDPGPWRQEQHGRELRGDNQAQHARVGGEHQHQPGLRAIDASTCRRWTPAPLRVGPVVRDPQRGERSR